MLVFADQREEYLQVLRQADTQEPVAFIDFVARCARTAFQLLRQSLKVACAPDRGLSLDKLERAAYVRPNLTYEQLEAAAIAFLQRFQKAFQEKLPSNFEVDWTSYQAGRLPLLPTMRTPETWGSLEYGVSVRVPGIGKLRSTGCFELSIPRDVTPNNQFHVLWSMRPPETRDTICSIYLDEILHPESPRVRLQFEMAATHVSDFVLDDIANKAETYRRQRSG